MNAFGPMTPYPQYQQQYMYQPQYQPQTPTPRAFSPIAGRIVNSLDEITVQEVPTDGTVAWFPSADGSCVYGKRWTPDGNITTMRFVPEATETTPSKSDPFQTINARIDELFELVEEIKDGVSQRRTTTTKRKAVTTDAE